MSKTHRPQPKDIKRAQHELDASAISLGRLATRAATLLRGKHKTSFTTNIDTGDFVVIKNASKVKLTGRKLLQKEYMHYSGYPGGLKRKKIADVLEKRPESVIRAAVFGMLPANRMRKPMLKRLKIEK